ncbi:MAG: MATE family efflux transporter [Bacillota bacterium]
MSIDAETTRHDDEVLPEVGPDDQGTDTSESGTIEADGALALEVPGFEPDTGARSDAEEFSAEEAESPEAIAQERRELRKRIIDLALPSLIEMTLMTLVSMADMIMVGRLGPWAITSVGLSNQPMFVSMSVFMSLNVGATALVARSIGAGKPDEAAKAARQALVIASAAGVLLAVLGVMFGTNILKWMGAESDVIGPGSGYLKIVALGLIFQGAAISLSASLRGAGDTRTPMSVNLVANVVNVVSNYLLIYGHFGFPRLEVAGAAVATTLSRAVACALIIRKVFGQRALIKMSLHDSFRLDSVTVGRILKVGLPAAGEQAVMRGGQMLFARLVSSFGTVVYAAHQVALNIEGLCFTPGMSFQTATTTLVGQSLGARKPKRAMRVGWEAVRMGMAVSAVLATFLFFFGKYCALLYSDDQMVIDLAGNALKIIALAIPFMIANFILAGGLRGAGDTRWTLYITAIGIWGVRLGVANLLAIKMGMGLVGAWVGMALDMCTRALFVALRFRTGHWTKIRI